MRGLILFFVVFYTLRTGARVLIAKVDAFPVISETNRATWVLLVAADLAITLACAWTLWGPA